MGNITFEPTDSLQETAKKTVLIYAGSPNLKKEMEKLKVDYNKVMRGVNTIFVLRAKEFGRVEVKL